MLLSNTLFFVGVFFKKSVKTAVPEDGNPPGALVLTKLVEWSRFGVGDEKSFFAIFCFVVCCTYLIASFLFNCPFCFSKNTTNNQKSSRPEAAGAFSGEKRHQKCNKCERRQLIWLAIKLVQNNSITLYWKSYSCFGSFFFVLFGVACPKSQKK